MRVKIQSKDDPFSFFDLKKGKMRKKRRMKRRRIMMRRRREVMRVGVKGGMRRKKPTPCSLQDLISLMVFSSPVIAAPLVCVPPASSSWYKGQLVPVNPSIPLLYLWMAWR